MKLKVRMTSGSEQQEKLRSRLTRVLSRHSEIESLLFTHQVIIDDSEISHSHPVLTLGTRSVGTRTDLGLLSVFIHEQMHWFVSLHPVQLKQVTTDLERVYPTVKMGRRQGGARNKESTYLHLLVCSLEVETLSYLIGRKRAIEFVLKKPYYRWIYHEVVSNASIAKIMEKRGLVLSQLRAEQGN